MPVPTETLYNTKRMNVLFAVVSFVALVTTGWMLWHDFNRPWRHIQKDYFNLRSALAHFDALKYENPQEQEKHRALVEAVRAAEASLATPENQARERDLTSRETTLAGRLQAAALEYGNLNAELQVMLFNVEEHKTLHGPESPKTLSAIKAYEARKLRTAEIKAEQEKIEDELRAIRDELKAFYKSRTEARKALAAYEKGRDDAERLDRLYGPGIVRFALNIPGLDSFPTKDTPGRQEVRQVFSKGVRFNYNFVDSYVTDRCITCHVGIDDPTLTPEGFVKRTEAALASTRVQAILREENEKLARELVRRLADVDVSEYAAGDRPKDAESVRRYVSRFVDAANLYLEELQRPSLKLDTLLAGLGESAELTRGRVQDAVEAQFRAILDVVPPTGADGKTRIAFEAMSPEQKTAYFSSLTAAMNLYLQHEGRPAVDLKSELRAHPRLDLYLSPDSAHPLKSMGCTVCHEGSGQETDFVFAAHTPTSKKQKEEWAKKYYVKELGVPLATFHLVEEFWERPMLLPDQYSASCRKCHDQTFDLERSKTFKVEAAERIVEGREMFTAVGCINCHNVEGLTDSRKVGPDLAHVGEKLTPGFMEKWIAYPADFRPSTRMPHFFRQENNLPSSANEFDPDPVLRSEVEIQSMVHYLNVFSRPYDAWPTPAGLTGDAARGEELFASIGCLACHVNLAAKNPLDEAGRSFAESWIVTDLKMAQGLSDEEAKKRFDAMSPNDRARYASDTFTRQRREAARHAAQAEELAADREGRDPDPRRMYIPPEFTRLAPELSGFGTKMIPAAGDAAQTQRAVHWLYNWLREPRHYSSYTKMPRLFRENIHWADQPEEQRKKTDQDILDVAAYLLSLRNDEFKPDAFPETSRHAELRNELILSLLTGQNTESVSRQILSDEPVTPSDPYGRLTAAIVSQTAVSFGGGDTGKQAAVERIASRSPTLADRQKLYLGMKMISHYGCYSCHNIVGFEDATRPGTDLTLWAQKFMSQLDFAFFSPPFEHEIEKQPEVFGKLYREDKEFEHLSRDGGNEDLHILHNHGSFAYHKMRNPRIWDREKIKKPYEKLKMPNFFFSPDEAKNLVTYLLSMKDRNVAPELRIPYDQSPAGRIARGRALVRELNCIGCHTIESNVEATIHQYYSTDTSLSDTDPRGMRFQPPLLWGEGAKVQFDWLFSFLNNVEMLRPWLKVRMPSFHLTKEQATILVEYFAALSQDESAVLKRELDKVVRQLQTVHNSGGGSSSGATHAWFLDPKFADQAAFLSKYGVNQKQVRANQLTPPDSNDANEIADSLSPAFDRLVTRGQFLASLFDVKYPFADPETHRVDDARFKLGEEFLYNQKCLACHVAGDPSVPGTTLDIKAPNFALTYKRLRYDWVIKWLQDPQAIQPGANMPQIFQGGSAFAGLPDDQRNENEARFGKTVEEQSTLLVDFLFNLGARGYTAVQPGGITPPAPAEQPSGEFDFDSGGETTSKPAEGGFDF